MTAHLGPLISALVDEQLGPEARDRALGHVAGCDRCTREVADARAARAALRACMPEVPPAFMSRLLALSEQCEPSSPPPVANPVTRPAREPGGSLPGESLPPRRQALCGDVRIGGHARWRGVTALGVLATTGVAAAGLFILGDRPVVIPQRASADALSTLAGAPQPLLGPRPTAGQTADVAPVLGQVASSDVLGWMQDEGWQPPQTLPDGLVVVGMTMRGERDDILELDLESASGRVVLREQKGQLELSALEGLDQVEIGGHPVYIVSDEPVHLVWQSSDTVIDLVAEPSLEDVLQLVSTFTVDEFDTGFQARVGRGWSTLTGVL